MKTVTKARRKVYRCILQAKNAHYQLIFLNLFLKFIFRAKGRRKERNLDMRVKHPSTASYMCPTRDRAGNQDMRPDWELSWQPFGILDNAQPASSQLILIWCTSVALQPREAVSSSIYQHIGEGYEDFI